MPGSCVGLLVALLVTASTFWFAYRQSAFAEVTPCAQDPLIDFNGSSPALSFDACEVFSLTYSEARSKFKSAARRLQGSELYSLPILEDLTIDIAILPGKKDGTIVHVSGTHGVEGYTGSAIQIAFMKWLYHHQQQNNSSNDDDFPTFVFIHALNPYGMHNYRRVNENNVDLNRNAITDFATFLSERPDNVANYDTFRELISPNRAPSYWYLYAGFWITAVVAIAEHGFATIKQALVSGQYHHPQGCFYGGRQIQPSLQLLFEFIEEQNETGSSILDDATVWLDIHTGLGPFGKDSLFVESSTDASFMDNLLGEEKTSNKEGQRQLFSTAFDIIARNQEAEDDIVVSDATKPQSDAIVGYDLSKGFIISELARRQQERRQELHPERPSSGLPNLFVAQEFGTLPGILVGRALMMENAIHQHSKNNAQHLYGQSMMQGAFYPHSTKWRHSIIQRGLGLLFDSIEYCNKVADQRVHATKEDNADRNAPAEGDREEQKDNQNTEDDADYKEQIDTTAGSHKESNELEGEL